MALTKRLGFTTQSRLRWGMVAFFLAMAVPALVLVVSSYRQLKWEALHQQRGLAVELIDRINTDLQSRIIGEEARSFSDYQFLTVTGDEQNTFLQPSELSALPPASALPGVLGYFQVDNNGSLTSPLMPPTAVEGSRYGVSSGDYQLRQQRFRDIQSILSDNQLIREQEVGRAPESPSQSPSRTANATSADSIVEEIVVTGQMRETDTEQRGLSASKDAQRAFDELLERETNPRAESSLSKAAAPEPKKDQSKLEAQPAMDLADAKDVQSQATSASVESRQRATRKEQNLAYSASPPRATPVENFAEPPAPHITVFESEVDPFVVSMLDSGHLVLFRKVWREGQRFTQGMLLETETFINNSLANPYRATSLSESTIMVVGYQNRRLETVANPRNPYSRFVTNSVTSSRELEGELLLESRLSEPFSDVRLSFYVNDLPLGPGAKIILWTSVILGAVLLLGTLVLYRLGSKQIRLARQQQDFVSAVSHELKTPLTSIRMYGEMLRAGWAEEHKKKQYYDFIYDESERLSRLINNVLQLARMNRQELDLQLKPVKVSEILSNLESKLQSQVERAGFILRIEAGPQALDQTLMVDTDAFLQVIINLVDNALKFAGKSEPKTISIDVACLSGQVLISVRDFGPGISRQHLRKIFQLFYRAENELTRETVGTGIGLALVKQLVQAMEGSIDVVNREPGAEFRLLFPIAKNVQNH